MKKTILVSLLTLLLSTNLAAEPEDWYFNASIGVADKQNPDSVEQAIVAEEDYYGVSRVTVAIDVGFYWPVFNTSMLLGVVKNISSDSVRSVSGSGIISHTIDYNGLSAIYFFRETIGDGFFIRGDAGSAAAEYQFYEIFRVGDGSGSSRLIGVGYSKALYGNKTRLIFSLNSVRSVIEDREFNTNQLMMGFMW
ncbi:MAG: hypothetical protein OEY11_12895 [Gammaproteobacteria bacterium]|nr:hypothetical protein [Gammaproteobacteria bacterium]